MLAPSPSCIDRDPGVLGDWTNTPSTRHLRRAAVVMEGASCPVDRRGC